MDRRRFKRIDTIINAEVTIGNKYYRGTIENVSEEGLFEIVFIEIEVSDFAPEKILGVRLHNPSGEDLHLQCRIIWLRVNKDNLDRLLYSMGMEIISPLPGYRNFVKTL